MNVKKAGLLVVKILLLSEIVAVLSAQNSSPVQTPIPDSDIHSFHLKGHKTAPRHEKKLSTIWKQEQFVPMKSFGPVFDKSLLLFRGDTVHFDFDEIRSIGVPYLHITSVPADNTTELASYDRINSLNIFLTFRWFVRQQVTIFGEMEKPWSAMHPEVSDYKLKQRTLITVNPQTLIVIDTWINRGDTFRQPTYSILDVFERTARSITFLFNYDLESVRPLDAFVFCSICRFERHMLPKKDRPRQDVTTLRFEWDLVRVASQLVDVRSKITRNGQNCLWSVKNLKEASPGLTSHIRQDEFSNDVIEGLDSTAQIMSMEKLDIAATKVLFPASNETSTENCFIYSDCEVTQAYCIGAKSHEFRACVNRGLTIVPYPGTHPTLTFTNNNEELASVVFITTERVQIVSQGSMRKSVDVVEPSVWVLMSLAICVTSLVFAMLQRLSTSHSMLSGKGQENNSFLATVVYFFLAFLGQYPRNLPLKQSTAEHQNATLTLTLVPWFFGLVIITNWYTAFLSSSFNFKFPYELAIRDWHDFENFSLYLIFDGSTMNTREKEWIHLGQIQGKWHSAGERHYMAWDLDGFNRMLKPPHLSEYHEGFPSSIDHTRDGFLPECDHAHFLPTTLRYGFPSYSGHPTPVWLHDQKLNVDRRSHSHSTTCSKEQNIWAKMIYHMDAIDQSELSQYVGFHYKNLTRQGRKLGLELIHELGNKTFEEYKHARVMKRPFVMPNDGEPDGNTFYWMTRRSEAVFLVAKTEFPWYWNKFKKLMRDDQSLKFAHTGPQELKYVKIGQGLGGNGFESPISISGPWDKCLPEFQWMMQRIRALTHSGILGFFAKWDQIVRPPTKEPENEFIEESDTGYQALTMEHDLVKAAFTIFLITIPVAVLGFISEYPIQEIVHVLAMLGPLAVAVFLLANANAVFKSYTIISFTWYFWFTRKLKMDCTAS